MKMVALLMMNDPAPFRAYLQTTLVMSAPLADLFIVQGISTFWEMQKPQEDDISWIIEIIRNLGVTIKNSIPVPSAVGCCRVAVSTPVAHPAVILNPCLKANFLQQKRLKCLVHYLKHYIRVQRDFCGC